VRGVPTSQASADLARQLGIALVTLDEVETLDAPSTAPTRWIRARPDQGLRAPWCREIVAASAKKFVVLSGPEKLVPQTGTPASCRWRWCRSAQRWAAPAARPGLRGGTAAARRPGPSSRTTATTSSTRACRRWSGRGTGARGRRIPGVVGTGLFVGLAHTILVQHADRVEVRAYGCDFPLVDPRRERRGVALPTRRGVAISRGRAQHTPGRDPRGVRPRRGRSSVCRLIAATPPGSANAKRTL